MSVQGGPLLGLCALLLFVGCSSEPDVVAHQQAQNVDPYLDVQLIEGCAAGQYRGYFWGGTAADAGGAITVSGTITFTLELGNAGGEFLVIRDSKLEGKTDSSNLAFSGIVTNLEAGGCEAGHFDAWLRGDLQYGNSSLHFEGPVEGNYADKAFTGTWVADFAGINLHTGGGWGAQWFPTVP